MRGALIAAALVAFVPKAQAQDMFPLFNDACIEPLIAGSPPDLTGFKPAPPISTRSVPGIELYLSSDDAFLLGVGESEGKTTCLVQPLNIESDSVSRDELHSAALLWAFDLEEETAKDKNGFSLVYYSRDCTLVWAVVTEGELLWQLSASRDFAETRCEPAG